MPAPGRHADLLARGFAVHDDFVPQAGLHQLIACARQRRRAGEFAAAGVGAPGRVQRLSHVRGDRTRWLEEPLLPAERALLADFEQLRCDLNRESYLGLFDFEAHYAWYPSGTGYVRHVDQSGTRQHRQVSVVLYLNPHWRPADGGHLRFFDADGYIDIEPIAGRLVYFLSAGREHEVLTTRTDRWSIAGWFRLRERAVN